MPDGEPYIIKAKTRRELKAVIENEARMVDSGETQGLGKRAIAAFVAQCWREAHKPQPAYLPYCLPMKERQQSTYSYGIFCSVTLRGEYIEQNKEAES
jgi:hypothetical protein